MTHSHSSDSPDRPLPERLRRWAGGQLVQRFFEGAARFASLHPGARPDRHDVMRLRDVSYGPLPEHHLDIWRPRSRGPHPVILYVHGGGFRILSKDTHWIMGLALARAGYLVLNIDYRLAPEHPFPAAIEDTIRAWAWTLEHAEEFGGDLSRLGVGGESAGANLITALTVACCWEREEAWARQAFELGRTPDAVMAACGIFQVSDVARIWRRRPDVTPFIRDRFTEVSDAYFGGHVAKHRPGVHDLADPLSFLERVDGAPRRMLPPFMIPVGTRDPLIDDARRMQASLHEFETSCRLKIYPGEVHAFHAFVFREQARACWRDIYRFLGEHV